MSSLAELRGTKVLGVYLYFVSFSGGRPCSRCRGKKIRRKGGGSFDFKLFDYKFILVCFGVL